MEPHRRCAPSPLAGEGWGGGVPHDELRPGTPTPDPSPQGGGEKSVPADTFDSTKLHRALAAEARVLAHVRLRLIWIDMKVTFAQHGGQAAGILLQRPPLVIDTAALDEAAAAELQGLVAAAAAAPPRGPNAGRARDEMSYTITIQDDGRETALSQSDTTMSAEFAKLLAWLRRHPAK